MPEIFQKECRKTGVKRKLSDDLFLIGSGMSIADFNNFQGVPN
jgi:hypothetical protein